MSEELISIKNRLDKILNSGKEPVYCEELITTGELQRLLEEIERLHSIIKEVREMLEHKVEFSENVDFYKDEELRTHVYYNYVACLQDFDEIVGKYKVEEK